MADSNNNTPLVAESVLKRKHDLDELKIKREANEKLRGNNKVFSKKKRVKVRKPEKYLAEARAKYGGNKRYKRVSTKGMQKRASDEEIVKQKEVEVPGYDDDDDVEEKTEMIQVKANSVNAKMVFLILIRNEYLPKPVSNLLKYFRLKNLYEGVFVDYNESTRKKLHLIETYVVYGVVAKSTVTDLLTRRGFLKLNTERVPLTDNIMIEKALGDSCGIICVEDVVQEICHPSTNFGLVNKFIWPFQLSAPTTRFEKDILNYKGKKGDYGDKGEFIDALLRKML